MKSEEGLNLGASSGIPPPTFIFSQSVSQLVQLVNVRKLSKLMVLILIFTHKDH